jgi:hypothetical protein
MQFLNKMWEAAAVKVLVKDVLAVVVVAAAAAVSLFLTVAYYACGNFICENEYSIAACNCKK